MHPDTSELIRAAAGTGPEDPAAQIAFDEHISECAACRERMRSLLRLHGGFEQEWDAWSARAHGEASHPERAAVPVTRAAGVSAFPAIRILTDCARRLATVAAQMLPAGFQFSIEPAFHGVGSPQGDTEALLQSASKHLAQGRADAAAGALEEAGARDARSAQAAFAKLVTAEGAVAAVALDSRRASVSVKLWLARNARPPAFAILIPDTKAAAPVFAEYRAVEGEDYLLAEFSEIHSGISLLVLGIFPGDAP